ncbi:Dolichyl-diphosphooligosaccharide-protein glycosyltransferase subunit 3 [Smittium culicis]|uniref:Dolichyl-diphosphooligosaccharide-protein glycosyltransferase subunit 3 n=1 Tax=Smittium culicis TaxID=133412 RepID=A0A1R1X2U6_9FUNG|nr:Dolichyl-diphosphooligosaccharide-protein glycosyltransferase subunit 3 [Smittium culicis]
MKKLRDSNSNGFPEIRSEHFFELSKGASDFSVVFLLTALEESIGCKPCQATYPEFIAVANHWKTQKDADEVFFVFVDAMNSIEVFRKLQLMDPPKVFIFPSLKSMKESGKKPTEMRIGMKTTAETLASEIGKALDKQLGVSRPFDYMEFAANASKVAVAVVFLYFLLTNRAVFKKLVNNLFLAGILVFVIVLNSGYVWTYIKDPPFTTPRGNFVPGIQEQAGIETLIVSSLYGTCVAAIVFLIKRVPTIKNETIKLVCTVASMAVITIAASYIVVSYKSKNPSYPYKILF